MKAGLGIGSKRSFSKGRQFLSLFGASFQLLDILSSILFVPLYQRCTARSALRASHCVPDAQSNCVQLIPGSHSILLTFRVLTRLTLYSIQNDPFHSPASMLQPEGPAPSLVGAAAKLAEAQAILQSSTASLPLVCLGDAIDLGADAEGGVMKGHGTMMAGEAQLQAAVCGVVERVNKLVSVRALKGRYTAQVRRSQCGQQHWLFSQGAYRHFAMQVFNPRSCPGRLRHAGLVFCELGRRRWRRIALSWDSRRSFNTPHDLMHLLLLVQVGDVVVGRVTEVAQKRWKMDVNGKQDAALLLASVNLPGGVQR